MSSTVEQIKERLGIADVVSTYLKLDKAGKNYKGRCPFHNEKTPSFFVSPERESYYCFGCGAKGDIFTFVEHFEGLDFMGALKLLADRAGVEIERFAHTEKNPHAKLYEAVDAAMRFFVAELGKHADASSYVTSRGISPETVRAFNIGFAPADWRQLYDHLIKAGFREGDLLSAGLIKKKDMGEGGSGSHPYDVFRNRVMFPVFDASGRAVAFAGRLLGPESEHAPKYLNSPETPIFKKSETLYGFDKAKSTIRKHDFAILVEGQVDLVMAHQAGFTNAIAVMGTAFTSEHAAKLKRFSSNLAIALDADVAGIASALRTARTALAAGMDVKIVVLPDGKDPADVITKDGIDAWRQCVRSAVHVVDFVLDRIVRTETDDRKIKQRVQREALPFIASIPNAIDRAHFVERAARAMNVDESLVADEVARTPVGETVAAAPAAVPTISLSKHDQLVRTLVGIMLWKERDTSNDVANLGSELQRIVGSDPRTLFDADEQKVAAFEAEVAYAGSTHLDRIVDEMLGGLEEDGVRARVAKLVEDISRAERTGEAPAELLTEYATVSKRLDEIKNRKYVDK